MFISYRQGTYLRHKTMQTNSAYQIKDPIEMFYCCFFQSVVTEVETISVPIAKPTVSPYFKRKMVKIKLAVLYPGLGIANGGLHYCNCLVFSLHRMQFSGKQILETESSLSVANLKIKQLVTGTLSVSPIS